MTGAYGTTYEIFVYSFADSNGDGIGDLQGVIDKLDYINDGDPETTTDLGCDAIWLLPVCMSPTYHKYDVADYETIDEDYGTMDDFEALVSACHERGVKVYTDMVLNHTSVEHGWFQKAKDYLTNLGDAEPDASVCPYVDYYNFTKDEQTGYESLEGTSWYYEARFWSGMPDLNLDNENVKSEITDIAQFWLDKGVDGFRLDAVTSYFTADNDKNIAFLSWFNTMVKEKKSDAYLVGEAWEPFSTYADYYKSGIDSFFNFAFSDQSGAFAKTTRGQMSMADFGQSCINVQNRLSGNNANYVDATFTSNHDQARCAGYFSGDDATKFIRFNGALNLLMTGNAFVYYGEELGMKGSGKDENKRAPMQWGESDAAVTEGPADMEDIEMVCGSLADQQDDPYSIYNYYKEAIYLRHAFPDIATGTITIDDQFCHDGILTMFKTTEDKSTVCVVYNGSGEADSVDLTNMGEADLVGMLVMDDEAVTYDNGTLTMPAYSIAILK